ncbi:hypothetical protein [Streptomyces laculatispora]|uniref:hypothetical protein n=1 Tax=Streptomyces laculatispora TaxID=887464 RepID=UPI001F5FEA7E|nr:hypothetical protein [Streptomyces laculatispora]
MLADFRDRLTEGDRADRLLDLALARLKDAGLVRERGTQRADSTHVLAAVRDLTHLDLIAEAVRAALEEVADTSPHLLDELVDKEWGRRYGRPIRLGRPPKPKTRILATGNDAVRLLEHLYQHGADRASGPRTQALRQILVQNYYRDAAGRLRWRSAGTEGGPGLQHVLTAMPSTSSDSAVATDRGSASAPPADRLPELPRSARDPPAEALANSGQLTSVTPRSPTESSQGLSRNPWRA